MCYPFSYSMTPGWEFRGLVPASFFEARRSSNRNERLLLYDDNAQKIRVGALYSNLKENAVMFGTSW